MIPFYISVEFLLPELQARLRHGCTLTVGMAMPETTVNEYDGSAGRKNEVRASWKIAAMQPEAQSHGMRQTSNDQFRSSVLLPNLRHARPMSRPPSMCGGHVSCLLSTSSSVRRDWAARL